MPDIQRAYNLMVAGCNDPNVGYSQAQRTTIKLGVAYRTYCDCSSMIAWALTGGGFYKNNPWFSTYNEQSQLAMAGFKKVPIGGAWLPGDILWRQEHTEMVYKDRVTMGAHSSSKPFPDQVSINNYASSPSSWSECWRYGNGAVPGLPDTNISIYVASAILGNWAIESNINPGIWQDLSVGSGGYGLGQWSGGRRDNLFKFLTDNGYDQDSGMGQIAFFLKEDDWQASTSTPIKFNDLTSFLTSSSTDIAGLTETFMNAWERPGVPALDRRIEMARKVYDYIQDHSGDPVQWITGNRYLSEADQLNNAVAAYQILSLGESPDGGQGWSNLFKYGVYRDLYRRIYIHR